MLGQHVYVLNGIYGLVLKALESKFALKALIIKYFILIQSYQNWRLLAQYIDFALLDIQTLQYKNRTLAAAFLYLTILLKIGQYQSQQVVKRFRRESHLILGTSSFNKLFSKFLQDSFGFPLEEILPAVQYCSGFIILPPRFNMPELIREN